MGANLLRPLFSVEVGQDRSVASELWEVDSIVGWTAANTSTAVFAQIPRTENQLHPDPSLAAVGCAVRRFRLYKQIRPDVAQVLVLFDSARRWGFSVTPLTDVVGDSEPLKIPVWTLVATGGGVKYARDYWDGPPRTNVVRVDQRITTGQAFVYRSAVIPNVGKIYEFEGIPYILKTGGVTEFSNNQIRLHYRFLSKAPVQAIAAGSIPGLSIGLPALDYLEEYAPRPDPTTPGVGVIPVFPFYSEGEPLP